MGRKRQRRERKTGNGEKRKNITTRKYKKNTKSIQKNGDREKK